MFRKSFLSYIIFLYLISFRCVAPSNSVAQDNSAIAEVADTTNAKNDELVAKEEELEKKLNDATENEIKNQEANSTQEEPNSNENNIEGVAPNEPNPSEPNPSEANPSEADSNIDNPNKNSETTEISQDNTNNKEPLNADIRKINSNVNLDVEDVDEGDFLKPKPKKENKLSSSSGEPMIETANLNVVLLLDSSGSMKITDPDRLRDEGVRLFLQFLKEGDKVSIVEFSDKTNVLMEPSYYNKEGLDTITEGLSKIENSGHYTDLYSAIKKADEMLQADELANDENYQKVIVLFSDGKMDPDENIISKEDALRKLEDELILDLKHNKVKLYTLSFSDEADKNLLKHLANSTGALSWFTPNADTIHKSFSKLFLAVQKPQILPISDKGLRIDGQIDEATFYLNVKENKKIVIMSPLGKKIVKDKHDDDVKWFSGNNFEIITVKAPEPGLWNFFGSISKDDFATVLTKLKLTTTWPYSVNVNEENVLEARVYDGKKPIVLPEVSKLSKVAFRITPTDRVSQPIAEGFLNDDGENGDKAPLDGIFSTNLTIDTPGEYELWIVIKTPTFERHQKVPFIVKPRLVSLDEPIMKSDGTAEFQVLLDDEAMALKKVELNLIARKSTKAFDIPLKKSQNHLNMFIGSSKYLKEVGTYMLQASISGFDKVGSPVTSISQEIGYTQQFGKNEENKVATLAVNDDNHAKMESIDETESEESEKNESYLIEHIVVLLSNIILLFFVFIFIKKNSKQKFGVNVDKLVVSKDILAKISALEAKSKLQDVDESSFVFVDDDEDNDEDDKKTSQNNENIDANNKNGAEDNINYEEVTSVKDADSVVKTHVASAVNENIEDSTKEDEVDSSSANVENGNTKQSKDENANASNDSVKEEASDAINKETTSNGVNSESEAKKDDKQGA